MSFNSEQENFWATTYADDYIKKNSEFDHKLGADAWTIMLKKTQEVDNYLECGCNICRNIAQINFVLPDAVP